MPIDVRPLWDFSDPAASERRFRDAAAATEGDAALIYETQVARTHGLRRDFERAREVLAGLEPRLTAAGLEARAWYALELGRALVSAAHSDDEVTEEARATAREAFQTAHDLARAASCDAVAIDALHMMAFVDSAPGAALDWGRKALALVDASDQPDARRWEASLRNNTGYALHQLGRYEEALDDFRKAAALREVGTDAAATRAAHWMVAWTLRSLQRFPEALAIQLRLEAECEAAGEPDSYVYEELELLYRGLGRDDDADRYAARLRNAGPDRG